MGKYFRDISITTYGGQVLPPEKVDRDFNISTQNVENMFFYMIPRPIEFEGICKLNIMITDKPIFDDQFNLHPDGIAMFNYSTFDFNEYFQRTTNEQNEIILNLLRKIIRELGVRNKEEALTLLKVCDKIESLNFELEWESKKLTKVTRDKKYRATVLFRVDSQGQNAFIKIADGKGKELINEHLESNMVYEFSDNLFKSKWDKYKFLIINRQGQIFKEFSVVNV